jgi:hypothetical protein
MFFCPYRINSELQVGSTFFATYVRVKEERIHAPRERLFPLVEVWICGNFGKVTIVLMLQVFQMLCVLSFGLIHPGHASSN